MEKYTIDEALARLEQITESLEKNENDLEMAIRLYEEGVRLVAFCSGTLINARQRIKQISEIDQPEVE